MDLGSQLGGRMSDAMRRCVEDCRTCKWVCLDTIDHCLQMGGEHATPSHIRILMDCAEICQTSENFMLRQSLFHGVTCGACAEICERCEEDCRRFEGDTMMQRCADMCASCARSCREMAGMMSA